MVYDEAQLMGAVTKHYSSQVGHVQPLVCIADAITSDNKIFLR